jgi:hypothetical protein
LAILRTSLTVGANPRKDRSLIRCTRAISLGLVRFDKLGWILRREGVLLCQWLRVVLGTLYNAATRLWLSDALHFKASSARIILSSAEKNSRLFGGGIGGGVGDGDGLGRTGPLGDVVRSVIDYVTHHLSIIYTFVTSILGLRSPYCL